MEIVFPTTEETMANLAPCPHGNPCEDCFVERSITVLKAKFLGANGFPMPGPVLAIMERSAVLTWQETEGGLVNPSASGGEPRG